MKRRKGELVNRISLHNDFTFMKYSLVSKISPDSDNKCWTAEWTALCLHVIECIIKQNGVVVFVNTSKPSEDRSTNSCQLYYYFLIYKDCDSYNSWVEIDIVCQY